MLQAANAVVPSEINWPPLRARPEASDYEKLQVMKAKTMYEMVEDFDLGQGTVKLLFLTNSQADSISSSSQTLHKMLEALEIHTPKLVINC